MVRRLVAIVPLGQRQEKCVSKYSYKVLILKIFTLIVIRLIYLFIEIMLILTFHGYEILKLAYEQCVHVVKFKLLIAKFKYRDEGHGLKSNSTLSKIELSLTSLLV